MAHKHAAIKALRQTKKRTLRNDGIKRNISYLKKQTLKAVAKKDAPEALQLFEKMKKVIDKAAKRNVIKVNAAARKKSRLIKTIHAISKVQ